jgi:protein TonB
MNNQNFLLNTLFQNKNRFYGAYPLRLYYNERLLKSMFYTIIGFAAFIYMLRWSFHEEATTAMVQSVQRDSAKVIHIIDIETLKKLEEMQQGHAEKPKKGTPNAKTKVVPDKGADVETIDPKHAGTKDGDLKGKTTTGVVMPDGGPLVFHVQKATKPKVHDEVDKIAEYPDLYAYLEKYISYPPAAESHGKVMLSFVVELDGSLSNIRIIQSLEQPLDEEAMAAFENISKPGMWKPAELKGEQVRYRYIIPISFTEDNK